MLDANAWPPWVVWTAFAAAALVITVAGIRLAAESEELARRTGLGQALFGAVFLGASTSLSGLTTTVVAAANGHPELATSNAIGGIAAQTVFLVVADVAYRKSNLEHAAATLGTLLQTGLLIILLSLPLVASGFAGLSVLGVHPVSLAMVAAYVFGIRLMSGSKLEPMWSPQVTALTASENGKDDETGDRRGTASVWASFAMLALAIAVAGYGMAIAGPEIAQRTGLSQSFVGAYFTAIATSIPELVTAIAAVRRGAVNLAVGDIVGGNCFDVLFLAAADVAYREGPLFAVMARDSRFLLALTILLTAILQLGLLRREKHGLGNIGFESVLVLLAYLGAACVLALHGGGI